MSSMSSASSPNTSRGALSINLSIFSFTVSTLHLPAFSAMASAISKVEASPPRS